MAAKVVYPGEKLGWGRDKSCGHPGDMGDWATISSYQGASRAPAHTMVCAMVSWSKYGNVGEILFFSAEGSFDRLADFLHISVRGSEE